MAPYLKTLRQQMMHWSSDESWSHRQRIQCSVVWLRMFVLGSAYTRPAGCPFAGGSSATRATHGIAWLPGLWVGYWAWVTETPELNYVAKWFFCTGSKSRFDCQRRQTSVMFISKWQAKYWQMFNFELVFSVMNSASLIIFPFVFMKNYKALLTTPRGRVTLTYLSKLMLYYHWFRQWFVVL